MATPVEKIAVKATQAAELLSISRSMFFSLVQRKEIRRLPGAVYAVSDLKRWAEKSTKRN